MELIKRFERFKIEKFPKIKNIFEELSQGQHPRALVISCSDSRIIPELIFDAKPGELFVVRNIANIVPPYNSQFSSAISAIEYAIIHLKVEKAVILGHSQCGGITAVIENKLDAPHIKQWLSLRKDLVSKVKSLSPESRQKEAEIENIKISARELSNYPLADIEKVKIEGWYYDFIKQTLVQVF